MSICRTFLQRIRHQYLKFGLLVRIWPFRWATCYCCRAYEHLPADGTECSASARTTVDRCRKFESSIKRYSNLFILGYIPGGEALSAVLSLAQRLRQNKPELIYLLDRAFSCFQRLLYKLTGTAAVLGDSGKLYVSPDVIPIYRAMLPLSTIITPNWFEVE